MAKLTRQTYKLFGGTANPTGDSANGPFIGQFGSASAGTFVGTNDVATIQNLDAWGNGWIDACQTNSKFPPLPERTGVDYVQSYGLNYLYQEGIPEYSATSTYYTGSVVKIPSTVPASVTTAVSGTITGANVTISIFAQAVSNQSGSYLFTYNGTAWTLKGNEISDIFTAYGITVTGDPASDDTITVVFTPTTTALNLYKSLQDDNTGNDPSSTPYWWASWGFLTLDEWAKAQTEFLTTTNVHIIDTYVKGTSGYNVWSNGYCEQWGLTIGPTGYVQTQLVKAYKDTQYNVVAVGLGIYVSANQSSHAYVMSSAGTILLNSAYQLTETYFYIYIQDSGDGTYWKTCGYLAEGEY
jgi:hypothetical protein